MTTKGMIAVMQAYEEGKKIEYRLRDNAKSSWGDTLSPCWDWYMFDYRIKPEDKPVHITSRVLTPQEFAEKMESLTMNIDTEGMHWDMDDLMCETLKALGYEDGVKIFENTLKWYA